MRPPLENLQITTTDLSLLQESKQNYLILDVREPFEIEKASLPNSLNIPLNLLVSRMPEIPETDLIITLCHHGIRSLKAAQLLASYGKKVYSLRGGIDAISREMDSSIPIY